MASVQNPSSLRDAICWWHTCLARVPRRQAEAIRNGPVQDLFALRRVLELSCRTQSTLTPEQLQSSLELLAGLHEEMTHLSDELSPPQLDDLATAVQQRLFCWRKQFHPQSSLAYQGELHPVQGHPKINEIILLVLEEWLRIAETLKPVLLQALLSQTQASVELSLRVSLSPQSPLLSASALRELNCLQQMFFQLTQGEYLQGLPQNIREMGQTREFTGLFRWQPNILNCVDLY